MNNQVGSWGLPIWLILGVAFALLSMVVSIPIAILQGFFYLRDGVWPEWTVNWLIREVNPGWTWVDSPESWFGLHTILDSLPLIGAVPIVGFMVGLAVAIKFYIEDS